MNTAIVSNKSVFELAQSKGYIPTDYTLNENGFHGFLSEDKYYLEMCFIQKWLRDTHKIFVEVVLMQPFKYAYEVYNIESTEILAGYITYSDSYDFALLHGINEALQLI